MGQRVVTSLNHLDFKNNNNNNANKKGTKRTHVGRNEEKTERESREEEKIDSPVLLSTN